MDVMLIYLKVFDQLYPWIFQNEPPSTNRKPRPFKDISLCWDMYVVSRGFLLPRQGDLPHVKDDTPRMGMLICDVGASERRTDKPLG
jgi:hypothetical protein